METLTDPPEPFADPVSSQWPFREAWRWRRIAAVAALALATYLVALVFTLPARTVMRWAGAPQSWRAAGSAWDGQAANDVVRAGWRADPVESLLRLALAGPVTIDGPGVDLGGAARWRPGKVELRSVTGVASWSLIRALAPNLPFDCDVRMRVDLRRVALSSRERGGEGEVSSLPGACTARLGQGASAPIPALVLRARSGPAGADAVLSPRDDRALTLALMRVTPQGRLSATITVAGATLLPPGAATALSIETQL